MLKGIFIFLLVASGVKQAAAQPAMIRWLQMDTLLHPANDTLYVINFWASWCKPCVEELPAFVKVENELKKKKVRFIYISLDFRREYNSRFLPFTEQQLAGKTVFLLDEPDYNSWIEKVDKNWMGGIPATLILRNNPPVHSFQSHSFSQSELKSLIQHHLNHE